MKDNREKMSERQLAGLMDQWRVEMPDQSFFANLPAAVQAGVARRENPWWRALLFPLPAMSLLLMTLLFLGFYSLSARISADNKLARAAATWVSENYGWASIDRALEAVSGDMAASPGQQMEDYLSILERGTYQSGQSAGGSYEMIENLSDEDLELLMDEINNTRS